MLCSQLTRCTLSLILATLLLSLGWRWGETAQAVAAPQPSVTRTPRRMDAARVKVAPPPAASSATANSQSQPGPSSLPPGNASGANNVRIVEQSPAATQPVDVAPTTSPAAESTEPSSSPQLTPAMMRLRDQIRQTLAVYHQRPVNARDHSPWEVFHWVIAYNVDAEIYTKGPGGEKTTAVGWLCYNNPCRGQKLLTLNRGRPDALYGVGLEGHPAQFMAILGQSRVMADYPLRISGKQFTVADLVETNKLNCQASKELTFQLIGLSHYLDQDATWKSSSGETWSIPRLIREEISRPIHGSACGGTHRLMGLSYAVKKRRQRGQPVDGEYLRAETYVNDYKRFTERMQNADGSYSTEWFAGRGDRPDVDRRIQTTGHILEWMVFAASEEELHGPRLVQAVDYLSTTLLADPGREWKIGPLGHSLRALSLYDRRAFKPLEQPVVPEVARRDSSRRSKIIERLPEPPDDLLIDAKPLEKAAETETAAP